MPAHYVLFCKLKSLAVGLLRWCLFLVVMFAQMNLFENARCCLQCSPFMKVCVHME